MKSKLILHTEDGRFELWILQSPWRSIVEECDRSGALETGGILVGFHRDNQSIAVVNEAVMKPIDSSVGPNWFKRGVAGLRGFLKQRWGQKERSFYLGEWHYHPAEVVEPSQTDIIQMMRISEDPSYSCREPLMLIVGKSRRGQRQARVFVFPQGEEHLEMFTRPGASPASPSAIAPK